jgi:hypothetical protein
VHSLALQLSTVFACLALAAPSPHARSTSAHVQKARQAPTAKISLTDTSLALEGLHGTAPVPPRALGVRLFAHADHTIRLVGTINTAGGCTNPTALQPALTADTLRLYVVQPKLMCPAIFTPRTVYGRVEGLAPGTYQVEFYVGLTPWTHVEMSVP